ncbi:MAG: hypothetical protein L6282_05315 [Candidatus Methanoperedenaceae archaeon]|nr:hypothetical protein [Candidatus Methanoperedenaceae archaeon]
MFVLYLRDCLIINGKIISSPEGHEFSFSVPSENGTNVMVDIIPDENKIEALAKFNISEEMLKTFQDNGFFKNDIPNKLDKDLLDMFSTMSKAVTKVLEFIKYFFNNTDLNENLFSRKITYWSIDKAEWKRIGLKPKAGFDIRQTEPLNEKTSKIIQEYINRDFKPFFGVRHLHRAINETNSRYKWIDATIAAELAIKEFLSRKAPEIKTILMEVPSPPLDKLYGSILEKYAGEESPKKKQIENGAKMRNKLIHKPESMDIDIEKANKYIHDVENAINHLYSLL